MKSPMIFCHQILNKSEVLSCAPLEHSLFIAKIIDLSDVSNSQLHYNVHVYKGTWTICMFYYVYLLYRSIHWRLFVFLPELCIVLVTGLAYLQCLFYGCYRIFS